MKIPVRAKREGLIVKQGNLRVVKRLKGEQCDDPGTATPHKLRKRCVAGSIEACNGIGGKKGDETCEARDLAEKSGGHNSN